MRGINCYDYFRCNNLKDKRRSSIAIIVPEKRPSRTQVHQLPKTKCGIAVVKGRLDSQRIQQQLRFCSNTAAASNIRNNLSRSESEWNAAKKPFEEMPTLGALQFLRKFLPGGKYANYDATQIIMGLREDMGPICRIKLYPGRPYMVFTHNPHDFEQVFRNEGMWPTRPGLEVFSYYRNVHRSDFFQVTEGLIGTNGEKWWNFRSIVNPIVMQPKNIRLYFQKLARVNEEFIERIRQIRDPLTLEVPENFLDEISRWTMESVSVVALDKQLGLINENRENSDAKRLFRALNDFFTYSLEISFKPSIWKYYQTKTFKKLMTSMDEITNITSHFVEEAIARLEENRENGVPEKPDNEKSVLEKLIKIDKKIAMIMAMDMLLAGADTTSSTFAGILLCMSKNPEKQEILRSEVRKILPHKDSKFNESSFGNMSYLRACIKESLRMYPLTVGTARKPANNLVLSGYRVPKDTQVSMVSTSLLQNDRHYPRAREFLPERWLRTSKDYTEGKAECPHNLKASSPFIYLPFGYGLRACIGRRIAEIELELCVARLIRNFQVEFNYPTENAFKGVLINVPNIPLKFKFTNVKD
ncbi:cytochrome P450 CYP12A2-like [Musca vetustissima]|uniref:cytochrome P450 CYP12A2-like n=1 Tax=Musca vetustissima TaxID=27455 RepID=UPI002AB6E06D|nr:cytochrome P450 CYP12A2-like [Musca vetustissima]